MTNIAITRLDEADLRAGSEVMAMFVGGDGDDILVGGSGDDELHGNAGDDLLEGGYGADTLLGGAGWDILKGGSGDDVLDGGGDGDEIDGGEGIDTARFSGRSTDYGFILDPDGSIFLYNWINGAMNAVALVQNVEYLFFEGDNVTVDVAVDLPPIGTDADDVITVTNLGRYLYGHAGNDTLIGGAGIDYLEGGSGDDTMIGGAGDDVYGVDSVGDVVVDDGNDAADTVHSSISYVLGNDIEILHLSGDLSVDATGNAGNNIIGGNYAANTIAGLEGDDIIEGRGGADILTGGPGADIFYYFDAFDSDALNSDVITDFQPGIDKIDLSDIDANIWTPQQDENLNWIGPDSFTAIGQNAFSSTPGELRWSQTGTAVLIEGDSDGDGVADIVIHVNLVVDQPFAASDFIL